MAEGGSGADRDFTRADRGGSAEDQFAGMGRIGVSPFGVIPDPLPPPPCAGGQEGRVRGPRSAARRAPARLGRCGDTKAALATAGGQPTTQESQVPAPAPPVAKTRGGAARLAPSAPQFRALGGSDNDTFNNVLANAVAAAVWRPGGLPPGEANRRVKAALTALMAFKPRDEIEGMIAAQAVALHQATMECLRRAMIPEQPAEAATKLRREAANLARCMVEATDAIERRRGKAPQVVRVEKVTVQPGGHAIVGAVATGSKHPPGGGARNGF